jgi:hypothetical protein
MEGYAHRVSAAALRSRGLLRVSGHGPSWRAELTRAGLALLSELDTPPLPERDQPTRPQAAEQPRPKPAPGRVLKTEQLVADVIAAGGKLLLPDETMKGGVNWRQRAYAAQRHGKVPDGKRLSVVWSNKGFEIELLDGTVSVELDTEPVPVPARVRNYHPAVREFRDQTYTHEVSRKLLTRALRIMHALAIELDRRGHKITCVRVRADAYSRSEWKATEEGQFAVTLNSHEFKLRLSEKGVGLRGPWEAHKKRRDDDRNAMRFDRWDVGRIEPFDKGATGQLELSILSYRSRQRAWGDRKRWNLEDRLPRLLAELEELAEKAEERRLAHEREEEERQRAWEAAMVLARERATRHHHLERLRRQVDAWQEAERIRRYCDAIEERHGNAVTADPEATRWLQFARQHADQAQRLPRMPADPELTSEDLTPFLGGWSPHGPYRARY